MLERPARRRGFTDQYAAEAAPVRHDLPHRRRRAEARELRTAPHQICGYCAVLRVLRNCGGNITLSAPAVLRSRRPRRITLMRRPLRPVFTGVAALLAVAVLGAGTAAADESVDVSGHGLGASAPSSRVVAPTAAAVSSLSRTALVALPASVDLRSGRSPPDTKVRSTPAWPGSSTTRCSAGTRGSPAAPARRSPRCTRTHRSTGAATTGVTPPTHSMSRCTKGPTRSRTTPRVRRTGSTCRLRPNARTRPGTRSPATTSCSSVRVTRARPSH